MFKDKYTRDVEKIKFEGSLKRYIKAKMRQEKSSKKNSVRVISVLAAMVCVCVVASLLSTPKNPSSVVTPIVDKKDKILLSGAKYSEIYEAIALTRENNSFIDEDSEMIIGDLGDSGVTTGTTSKPASSNKDDVLTDDSTSEKPEHSTTNNQVVGIDETDIVKTDGEYIYVAKQDSIKIAKATDGELELLSSIELEENYYTQGVFISDNRLAVLLSNYSDDNSFINVYDITEKINPTLLGQKTQSGYYFNSRMINGTVYFMTTYYVGYNLNKDDPKTYIPLIDDKEVKESDITYINNFTNATYLVVSAFDIDTVQMTSTEAFLGGAENIYCDNDSLYFTFTKFEKEQDNTYIVKMGFSKSNVKIQAMGEVKGRPLNQFSMDEYNGNLRIVTTVQETVSIDYDIESSASSTIVSSSNSQDNILVDDRVDSSIIETVTTNSLYVLDKNLKVIGKLENLAESERVYSVRFDGEIGYFVTFRQTDPLFTVDLKDPTKPTVLSELKIPGFSEYLHPFGEGKLFGFGRSATEQGLVTGLKLSMFNVSNPADVTEESTISINSAFSEASGNHKAIMVDSDKNIIAFAAMSYYGSARVYIYSYDENDFVLNKMVDVGKADIGDSRFVWIGDYFYLAHSAGITSFDLESFNMVSQITF